VHDQQVAIRAVVFDLWNTLAEWPDDLSQEFRRRWSARIGRSLEEIDAAWSASGTYEERESGPIAVALHNVCDVLGVEADVDELVRWRVEIARQAVVPSDGVLATLAELRQRGIRVGLISNCTEDVALVWPDSPFAEHFDAAVLSATAGCMKPDRRIYEQACVGLGVEPEECLFVGDGANDELRGARDVGMTPVLIHRDGEDPPWDGLRDWDGLRITSIPQVLDLVP
jgi:putative hydrolase of the HAD superfamily